MRSIPFSKYHGLGNHFIIVDNREGCHEFGNGNLVKSMCDVKTGIGADCLFEVRNCGHGAHKICAFEIVCYRCDGTISGFCGNGSRCVVKYACRAGIAPANREFTFCAVDGEHSGLYDKEAGLIHVGMRDVEAIQSFDTNNYFVFTGSPNHVMYVTAVEHFDIHTASARIRSNNQLYHDEINAMFVEQEKPSGQVKMRTYASGINDEILACGTGAVGAALVTHFRQNDFSGQTTFVLDVKVKLGMIKTKATRVAESAFKDVYMIGPATHVFDGVYNVHV